MLRDVRSANEHKLKLIKDFFSGNFVYMRGVSHRTDEVTSTGTHDVSDAVAFDYAAAGEIVESLTRAGKHTGVETFQTFH